MSDVSVTVLDSLPQPQDEELRVLLRRFYRFITPADVEAIPPAERVATVERIRDLAQVRAPGTATVHVMRDAAGQATIASVVTDDMPFVVDSLMGALIDAGRSIRLVLHPQLVVERDAEGRLIRVLDLDVDEVRPAGTQAESWTCIRMDRDYVREDYADLEARLHRVLGDVRASVDDWLDMRDRAERVACELHAKPPVGVPAFEVEEAVALLRWLADDNFTFLGYREYALEGTGDEQVLQPLPATGLGILRMEPGAVRAHRMSELPAQVRERAQSRHILVLSKANSRSTVHRTGYLDYVGVKRFDANGLVTGERRFLGLFAAAAYNASVMDVPVVRERVQRVMDALDLVPGSHSARDLRQFFETYPRDELFQTHTGQLVEIAASIMHLQERRETRLYVRPDDYGRFVSCLVYLPRDRYTTRVRQQVAETLRAAFDGTSTEYTVLVTESVLARLHVIVHLPAGAPVPEVDLTALEVRLAAATQSWDDQFTQAVVTAVGEERAKPLLNAFADAFPEGYKEEFVAQEAVADALAIESLEPGELSLRWYDDAEAERGARFTVIRVGSKMSLSRLLPTLQHLGVEVRSEHPFEVERADAPPAWVLDFALRLPVDDIPDAQSLPQRATDAFRAAWTRACESDGFSALVVRAGLAWQQVQIVRAYAHYLRQVGLPFSQDYIQQVLAGNVSLVRMLVRLFEAMFDPAAGPGRDERVAEAEAAARDALEAVPSLDHDRIFRAFLAVIGATLRTNAFALKSDDRSALAFKLDARSITELPRPRPRFEIWAYSPRVEGVHLRFGMVARGGLRWSDRPEDFRTEILGLVKAQEVKNAVIVPVGAKGGFFANGLPDPAVDRDAWLSAGKAAYREFVSALLDLTDNLVDGSIVPPQGVVRRDGDDPYLVVAADKGTASFSDLANDIAREYGFWLGDAFASGGSVGYDHKAMGITARGAWESVRRHFRELGIDTQAEEFTAVGIGDMSGDVFGNGMMLSPHVRLIAAFDHRDVFIDPDPVAATAFLERTRLFALPRSSWADYDPALISAGGGVYSRRAKAIDLSPQARAVLGLPSDGGPLTPNEVIRAVLTAPVDLLWNGGIGTYVKAQGQSHADVGDKANDAIRIDGRQLRCRVAGEGGNLGFTQSGRVEAALAGVRINTDAIDNSAGVDTSDHEVNIKILLQSAIETGALAQAERVDLLESMTDEVATAVLADNYGQNVALGNARAGAPAMASVHQRLIRDLERDGILDRALEFLPDDAELDARMQNGSGLTGPELAVLLAYAKNWLTAQLDDSDLPADPWFAAMLRDYFPARVVERFPQLLQHHRLHDEIINTVTVNRLVNRGGITFVFRAMEESGAAAVDVVRAATIAEEVFGLQRIWDSINELDGVVPAQAQDTMHLEARRLLDRATRWVLQTHGSSIDVAAMIARYGPIAAEWSPRVPDFMLGAQADAFDQHWREYARVGVPEALAREVAALLDCYPLLDIADVSRRTGEGMGTLVPLYFVVTDRYDGDRTLTRITSLPRTDRWATQARQALRSDLYTVLSQLTSRISRASDAADPAGERIAAWEQAHAPGLGRAQLTLADVNALDHFNLATLSVVLRVLRNLVTQGRSSANGSTDAQ